MEILIWIGSALTLAGVLVLLWCIKLVYAIRKDARPEAESRAALQKVVVLNMAALGVSSLGLMMVVIGAILG